MAWSDIVASGGGKWNLRLEIEGFEDEWVTSSLLAGTTSAGKERREGLLYDGLRIQERANIREADVDLVELTAQIRSPHARTAFARSAKVMSWLTGSVSASDTTFTVRSSGAFALARYHIGTEVVRVTAVPSGTTLTVTRQQWGTGAQKHRSTAGAEAEDIPITDAPITMANRRAYLYAYSENETGTSSDGTVVWRGVVTTDPVVGQDGLTWSIGIAPITAGLEQEVAGNSDEPAHLTKIVYSRYAPFRIQLTQHVDTGPQSAAGTPTVIDVVGEFDSESDFVNAVNSQLETYRAGLSVDEPASIIMRHSSGETWFDAPPKYIIEIRHTGTSHFIVAEVISVIDGYGSNMLAGRPIVLASGGLFPLGTDTSLPYTSYAVVPVLPIDFIWGTPTYGPRMVLGSAVPPVGRTPASDATPTGLKLWLDRDIGASANDQIRIRNVTQRPLVARSGRGSADDRRWTYDENVEITRTVGSVATGDPSVTIVAQGALGLTAESEVRFHGPLSAASLHGLVSNIDDMSVDANFGGVPWIRDGVDIDRSSLPTASQDTVRVPELVGGALQLDEPTSFWDIFREEVKIRGRMISLTSTGLVTTATLEVPTPTDPGLIEIDDDDILTPAGDAGMWPTYRTNPFGVIGIVSYQEQGGGEGDEPLMVYVRYPSIIGAHKNRGTSEMELRPFGRRDVDVETLRELASTFVAWLGRDYLVVSLAVSYTVFSAALLGAKVKVTSNHIPNFADGTLGVTDAVGIVVGREYSLDPADGGFGKLEIMMPKSQGDFLGYAPALAITGQSNVSGNQWTLTVSANAFTASPEHDLDHFAAGYLVTVVEKDSRTPATVTGTVDSVNSGGNQIIVTFDATWTPGADAWELVYRSAATVTPATGQQQYAYIADTGGAYYDGTAGKLWA